MVAKHSASCALSNQAVLSCAVAFGMDWVEHFYSVTGSWWGDAESKTSGVDRARSRFVAHIAPEQGSVLELGCGYGTTARVLGESGFDVVAIDLSDRIERAAQDAQNVRYVRGDFYTADVGRQFDVVCYWDGFGVGEDHDQVVLLKRIADEWLRPGGFAVIEVFHPTGWKVDDGLDEVKEPSPGEGYHHRLGHRRTFDEQASRAIDSWWELGSDCVMSQSLRCYRADEFSALASTAKLEVVRFSRSFDSTDAAEIGGEDCWSFLAVLRRSQPDGAGMGESSSNGSPS